MANKLKNGKVLERLNKKFAYKKKLKLVWNNLTVFK